MTTASLIGDQAVQRIAQHLRKSVGERKFAMWFDRTARMDFSEHNARFELAVPTQFAVSWINKNLGDDLRRAVEEELGEGVHIEVTHNPSLKKHSDREVSNDKQSPVAPTTQYRPAPHPHAEFAVATKHLSLRHDLETFVVGPSNELAYAAAVQLADEDSTQDPSHHNHARTLFVHGGCGLGKTHLLQGLCKRLLQRKPNARVLYTPAEVFTNRYITAVRSNTLAAFRASVRGLDLLAVDDVHFLADKNATQKEFLHCIDALDLKGARLVMAGDEHPRLIKQFSEALSSRCLRGLVVEVRQPDPVTRMRILQVLAQRRGLSLMDTVVQVLADHTKGSVREIEGALAKLHALATLCPEKSEAKSAPTTSRTVGHTLLNRYLESQPAPAPRGPVTISAILEAVCKRLTLEPAVVRSGSRHKMVVLARSLTVHLARKLTVMSYPEIATALGNASHSSMIAAAQRIDKQLKDTGPILLPPGAGVGTLSELVEAVTHDLR